LKTDSDFQTDGAAHRKERFAKSVRANGWVSSGVAVERSSVSAFRRSAACSRNSSVFDTRNTDV